MTNTSSRKKDLLKYNGLLCVRKPSGMISKDVSRWLTKRLGRVKLGHVGTLDPMAEGVLPLLFGSATRLQDYLLAGPKTYELECTFGSETDTLDKDGTFVKSMAFDHVSFESVRIAVSKFVGEISQIPPLYSAVKYKGKPLYDYARSGRADEIPFEQLSRKVSIYGIEALSYADGVAKLRVQCSKGTYVRVLAQDLASSLGTCATLTGLIRTVSSGLDVSQAFTLEQIEEQIEDFDSLLIKPEDIDLGLPKWKSTDGISVSKLRSGQQLSVDSVDFSRAVFDTAGEAPRIETWNTGFVLLDQDGRAFGLGSARLQELGSVQLTMNRGL